MPENKKNFKEKRIDRQEKRIGRLADKIEAEAVESGIDLKNPIDIGLSPEKRKARIDEAINKNVGDDLLRGLKTIQDVRTPPEITISKKPEYPNLTIKDVRKNRRAKIADITNSLASALMGDEVDPRYFSNRLKDKRLSQYKQYKDVSQSAKKRLDEWQTGYINEQLNYLKTMRDDPKTSELKRKQIQKQIEKTEADIAYKKAQTVNIGKNKAADDKASEAKYVTKIDDDKTITRNIPIEEAKRREREAALSEATQAIDLELQQAKLDLANMGEEGTKKREFIDKPKRDNLIAKIASLQEQKQQIVNEFEGKTPVNEKTPIKTTEEDIWGL